MSVNVDLLKRVMQKIESEPESWEQGWYATRRECGTSFCFAGHAVVLAGLEIDWDADGSNEAFWLADGREIPAAAEEVLGLSPEQAERLFEGGNTLDDLRDVVAEVIE